MIIYTTSLKELKETSQKFNKLYLEYQKEYDKFKIGKENFKSVPFLSFKKESERIDNAIKSLIKFVDDSLNGTIKLKEDKSAFYVDRSKVRKWDFDEAQIIVELGFPEDLKGHIKVLKVLEKHGVEILENELKADRKQLDRQFAHKHTMSVFVWIKTIESSIFLKEIDESPADWSAYLDEYIKPIYNFSREDKDNEEKINQKKKKIVKSKKTWLEKDLDDAFVNDPDQKVKKWKKEKDKKEETNTGSISEMVALAKGSKTLDDLYKSFFNKAGMDSIAREAISCLEEFLGPVEKTFADFEKTRDTEMANVAKMNEFKDAMVEGLKSNLPKVPTMPSPPMLPTDDPTAGMFDTLLKIAERGMISAMSSIIDNVSSDDMCNSIKKFKIDDVLNSFKDALEFALDNILEGIEDIINAIIDAFEDILIDYRCFSSSALSSMVLAMSDFMSPDEVLFILSGEWNETLEINFFNFLDDYVDDGCYMPEDISFFETIFIEIGNALGDAEFNDLEDILSDDVSEDFGYGDKIVCESAYNGFIDWLRRKGYDEDKIACLISVDKEHKSQQLVDIYTSMTSDINEDSNNANEAIISNPSYRKMLEDSFGAIFNSVFLQYEAILDSYVDDISKVSLDAQNPMSQLSTDENVNLEETYNSMMGFGNDGVVKSGNSLASEKMILEDYFNWDVWNTEIQVNSTENSDTWMISYNPNREIYRIIWRERILNPDEFEVQVRELYSRPTGISGMEGEILNGKDESLTFYVKVPKSELFHKLTDDSEAVHFGGKSIKQLPGNRVAKRELFSKLLMSNFKEVSEGRKEYFATYFRDGLFNKIMKRAIIKNINVAKNHSLKKKARIGIDSNGNNVEMFGIEMMPDMLKKVSPMSCETPQCHIFSEEAIKKNVVDSFLSLKSLNSSLEIEDLNIMGVVLMTVRMEILKLFIISPYYTNGARDGQLPMLAEMISGRLKDRFGEEEIKLSYGAFIGGEAESQSDQFKEIIMYDMTSFLKAFSAFMNYKVDEKYDSFFVDKIRIRNYSGYVSNTQSMEAISLDSFNSPYTDINNGGLWISRKEDIFLSAWFENISGERIPFNIYNNSYTQVEGKWLLNSDTVINYTGYPNPYVDKLSASTLRVGMSLNYGLFNADLSDNSDLINWQQDIIDIIKLVDFSIPYTEAFIVMRRGRNAEEKQEILFEYLRKKFFETDQWKMVLDDIFAFKDIYESVNMLSEIIVSNTSNLGNSFDGFSEQPSQIKNMIISGENAYKKPSLAFSSKDTFGILKSFYSENPIQKMAAKMIPEAFKVIFKATVEQTDPNIRTARTIVDMAKVAGADVPIEFVSLVALMPVNLFFPVGLGPPITPLGLAYLALEISSQKKKKVIEAIQKLEEEMEVQEGGNNSSTPSHFYGLFSFDSICQTCAEEDEGEDEGEDKVEEINPCDI